MSRSIHSDILVCDGVVLLEAGLHVISIEDGSGCGSLESLCSHHADVAPRDRQNRGRAKRRSTHTVSLAACVHMHVAGKEGRKVFLCEEWMKEEVSREVERARTNDGPNTERESNTANEIQHTHTHIHTHTGLP